MRQPVSTGEAAAFWVTMGVLISVTVAALTALGVVLYRTYWRPADTGRRNERERL